MKSVRKGYSRGSIHLLAVNEKRRIGGCKCKQHQSFLGSFRHHIRQIQYGLKASLYLHDPVNCHPAPGIAKERICQLIDIASYGHFLLNTVEQILIG